MAKLVSKTYGDALFAVALEENRMDEFFEAVKVVAEILRTNDEFGKLMNHPKIMKEDKVKIVEDTFSGRIPKEIVGVMTILVTKGRAEEMLSLFYRPSKRRKENRNRQCHNSSPAERQTKSKGGTKITGYYKI